MMTLPRLGVSQRLMLLVTSAVLGFVAVAAYALNEHRDGMFADRAAKVRSIIELSIGLAESLEKDVTAGAMTRGDALTEFRRRLTGMRFDGDNFVAVYDWSGINLVQPIKPEFVGRNMIGLRDPSGTPLVQRWIEIAKSGTPQTMVYAFVKPGKDVPQPKLGYVQGFAPWQIVLISGIYIDDVDAAYWSQAIRLAVIAAGAICLVGLIGLSAWRSIARGLAALTDVTAELAKGAYDRAVPGIHRSDEIGAIARAIDGFRAGLVERRALNRAREERQEVEARRAAQIKAEADAFEANVSQVLGSVDDAAADLQGTARGMSAIASAAADRATTVAALAKQTSSNVTMVSAAAEELGSSVFEISRQVRESASLAHRAVDEAEQTSRIVGGLSEAASRIGDMVATITGVAAQTNLLALNATIEAARAGEAGRGFAVVASEVKALAGQTAKAAEEITTQIASIQSSTGLTVSAIAGIAKRAHEISMVSSTISAGIDGQAAATREIVDNMSQAASGTTEVSETIAGLVEAAGSTEEAAGRVLAAAAGLSRQSASIGVEVSRFIHATQAA